MKHVHHAVLSYPKSFAQRVYVYLAVPLAVVFFSYALVSALQAAPATAELPISSIILAALYTLGRLFIAYVIALVLAVPLALLATSNRALESILLPLFDVLDSIPILAFFPVVILMFIQVHFLEGAAIFILFVNILWNIVFTVVGGLKIIPKDITYAARIFGLHGFSYFRRLLLPAIFPQLVTGSILALAEGWNLVIVAEALHAYVPHGSASQDLFGIGTLLVHAAADADNVLFVTALVVMVCFIAFFNIFIWQRLLRTSQRYRFD
jgi:NitT/TauT family transport system permease protein